MAETESLLSTCCTCAQRSCLVQNTIRDRRGRDRMVVGFTTTCAYSITTKIVSSNPVHVLDTTLCDKVVSDLRHVALSEYSGLLHQ